MSYLDIIKELEERLSEERNPVASNGALADNASGVACPERATDCEKSELSEKSPLWSSRAPAPGGKPAESTADPIWTPPLGRENDRGELVLTVADLPELERRLRLSGWKVERITGKYGSELVCYTGKKPRIQ